MARQCYVEASSHLAEYEKMRFDGVTVKEITAFAHNKYGENHLEYYHFQKHFANHTSNNIEARMKTSKLRDEVVKEAIHKQIEIARRLTRNLELVSTAIDEYAKQVRDNPSDVEILETFLKCIGESRLIIEQALKWETKLDVHDSGEETFTKIMRCLEDFPADLINKFAERWEEQNKGGK